MPPKEGHKNPANGDGSSISRPPRPQRPNYSKLHAQPIPIKTYPLPPLIPHNPISLLHIAFVYLSHLIYPPPSHPAKKHRAYFSHETRSVHVTDEVAIRAFWENGFFGKGSLSRSEPTWLDREKKRRGILVLDTSEEITRKRREERRDMKNERARKEREAIEERLRLEGKLPLLSEATPETDQTVEQKPIEYPEGNKGDLIAGTESSEHNDRLIGKLPSQDRAIEDLNSPVEEEIKNQEHLQLTTEEALYLTYGLGVLDVHDRVSQTVLTAPSLLQLARCNSYFPPRSPWNLQPDDPFILSYVVYHHFRALGWVVRPGLKFAVDYLLYNRGPVFSHAEFAVIILPSYSDPYWMGKPELEASTRKKGSKPWWWLHCVNRVQGQVRKSLVLVYVNIPPPDPKIEHGREEKKSVREDVHIGKLLQKYTIQEVIIKRWIPNRSRD
ncbi:hypothetical protein MMC25_004074 [Agyrium rufum]|nr:hypothetical protein [Agyrium rufum]